jgi:hypothetical protein
MTKPKRRYRIRLLRPDTLTMVLDVEVLAETDAEAKRLALAIGGNEANGMHWTESDSAEGVVKVDTLIKG